MRQHPRSAARTAFRHKILGSLSLREVAKRAGTSASTLCLLLAGKRRPRLDTAERLARVRGITLDEFFRLLGSGDGNGGGRDRRPPSPTSGFGRSAARRPVRRGGAVTTGARGR